MKKITIFIFCFLYFSSLKAEIACPVFNIERVSLTSPKKSARTYFIPTNPAVITNHITLARFGFGFYNSEIANDNGTKQEYKGEFNGIGLSLDSGSQERDWAESTLSSYGINTKGMAAAARFDKTNHTLKDSNETRIGLKNSSENYNSDAQAYGIGLFNKHINFGYSNRKSTEETNGLKTNLNETTRGFSVILPFGIRYGRATSDESYSSSELGHEISRQNSANGVCIGTGNGPINENDTNYFQLIIESFNIEKPNFVSKLGNFGQELTTGINLFFLLKLTEIELDYNYEIRKVNDQNFETHSIGFMIFDYFGFSYSNHYGNTSFADRITSNSSAYSFHLDADF